jgi:ribonuclease R
MDIEEDIKQEEWRSRPKVEGVTIDSAHSMDLDDAVNIIKQDNGWLIQVTIADVSHGVPIGSEFDIKAKKIAFTRYFANNHNHPMLPRDISEDRYSLLEGEERPVITASISLSREFDVGKLDISFMKLKSKLRLSYRKVDIILDDKNHQLHPFLNECKEIALALLEGRRQRGALAIYDLYRGWMTTEEGHLVKIDTEQKHIANIIVQEFMILANQGVAEFAAKNEIPILFRNHVAKTIAPQHNEILNDIYSAIQDPAHFSVTNLQKRMNLVLSRAIYSPLLLGHYGLNVPAYTHFTSPIRRYSDLVTHRMISAYLKGEKFPYTKDELFEISKHLTKIDQDIRDRRDERFKTIAIEKSKMEMQKRGLSQLPDRDLHRILKAACEKGVMLDELECELTNRINENRLPLQDIFYVLFKVKEDCLDQWYRVRKEALQSLANKPSNAVSVLEMVKQDFDSPQIDTETKDEDTEQQHIYNSILKFKVKNRLFVSKECSSSTKKGAEQLATVDLLAQIAFIPTESIDFKFQGKVEIPFKAIRKAEEITENYKGLLLEICQKSKILSPEFQIIKSGLTHIPEFKCTATIVIDGKTYQSKEVIAQNKKNAEQLASKDLLAQIPTSLTQDKEPLKPASIKHGNFVVILQEFCQKNGLELPAYIDGGIDGPAHSLTISVICRLTIENKIFESTSRAPNKKTAKQGAAEQVYRQLVEYFSNTSD